MTDEFANKLRRALDGNADAFFSIDSSDFDEWLESHDAEVRNEAIIARDTRTSAELIEAAWDAAYEVPEGRTIPAGTPTVMKYKDGTIMWNMKGSTYEIEFIETDRIRTLEPLPPVIPDGTPAVWASTKDCEGRRVLVLSEEPIGDMLRHWRDGDGDEYRDEQLINPVPIPKEGDR
jgi:hypothetical protein